MKIIKYQTTEIDRNNLIERMTDYLSVGGLFNPEHMDHNKVRDLIIDCREYLSNTISK